MRRRISWACAVLALLLGALHVGLTWPMYGEASLEALWFAGSGLAVITGSLCNIAALRATASQSRWLLVVTNLLLTGFFAAAWPLLKAPQVAVGFALFGTLATLTAFSSQQRAI